MEATIWWLTQRAMADDRVVEQLVAWLDAHRPYKWTGHHTSTARNARVKEVWIRFHGDLAVWWFAILINLMNITNRFDRPTLLYW